MKQNGFVYLTKRRTLLVVSSVTVLMNTFFVRLCEEEVFLFLKKYITNPRKIIGVARKCIRQN